MKTLYYYFIAALLMFTAISGCKLDTPVYPTKIIPIPGYDGPTDNSTSGYYFKGTLDGTAVNWQTTDGINGWIAVTLSALSDDPDGVSGTLTGLITDSKIAKPQFGVEIGNFHSLSNGDKSVDFKAFVKPGTWNFGIENNPSDAKFINITYLDADENLYSSATGNQTGSIEIVSVSPVPASFGQEEGLKVKLTFSCTLYPVGGTGDPLILKDAESTIFIENLL